MTALDGTRWTRGRSFVACYCFCFCVGGTDDFVFYLVHSLGHTLDGTLWTRGRSHVA